MTQRATSDAANPSDLGAEPRAGTLPYKFYVGDQSNQNTPPFLVECLNDSEALAVALRHATATQGVEVWLGDRLVCRVPRKQR